MIPRIAILPALAAFVIILLQACGSASLGPRDTQAVKLDPENDRVGWSVRAEHVEGSTWDIVLHADVDDGWYIYSTESFGDGPLPTVIGIDSISHVLPKGEDVREVSAHMSQGRDPIFEVEVRKFKHNVEFIRQVELFAPDVPFTGSIEYMTCNDHACLMGQAYFRCHADSGTFLLSEVPFDVSQYAVVTCGDGKYRLASVDLDDPVVPGDKLRSRDSSLWTLFLLGFIGGLLALLTPCVFPMVPLTVSFFTKGSEDRARGMRNAITYGAFILGIYLVFSIPFHVLGSVNEEIFNEISTNPWLNLFFFAIFIVFAISFFGYFEITLPSSWVNRMDQNASKFGGLIGIFFMALTLALVSFSCTGPILGSLLAGALTSDGGAWQLTTGMGGFGLALALPFALFAMFPQWLNSLPRSGSWLNSVKVVLGFVEVALAIKFLSNADLVMNWGLIKRELFIALWILTGIGLALYLFGFIRFPHDSPVKRLPPLRLGLGILTTAFVIYLIPGLTSGPHRNLKLLSGFPPPLFYSFYHQETECPLGLVCHHSIEEGMAAARASGKPLLIDNTGWACVNCRKMEETVWPDPAVLALLQRYELVSLYVDDKRELPAEEQHVYISCRGQKKLIRTEGNRWATLQAETFGSVSQPWYVLLSPEGLLLTDPLGYTPDKKDYMRFLQRGLDAMQVLQQRAGL
jgi:thiol:disulfide interchange protein DsbD